MENNLDFHELTVVETFNLLFVGTHFKINDFNFVSIFSSHFIKFNPFKMLSSVNRTKMRILSLLISELENVLNIDFHLNFFTKDIKHF